MKSESNRHGNNQRKKMKSVKISKYPAKAAKSYREIIEEK
jgi:hypothetical protein